LNNNAIIPSRRRILTITEGNSMDHENNNKKRNYFRRVNLISMEGPYKKTRWSYLPIIFSEEDFQLKDYPHMDAMIIVANIDGWAVSTILDEDLLGAGFPPSPAPVCCNRIVRGEVPPDHS